MGCTHFANGDNIMKWALCGLLVVAAVSVLAQDKNPVTSAVKEILPRQQKNLVGAAEAMPPEKYAYKPTEGQKTFGLIALANGWADHYSAAATYLRLNGLLPPTAQPKK